MKYHSRELLVTTKAAQHWQNDFDKQVDELMTIVSRVDTEMNVQFSSELMNVYHSDTVETPRKKGKRYRHLQEEKPFAFLVFKN